jgi:hypothetical protein
MFGEQFYPTPKAVIEYMLAPYRVGGEGYRFHDKFILEPSAGKGDIADFIVQQRWNRVHLDCIEIDPNLQHILRGKKHNVVGSDFLTFVPDIKYDFIFMNPPFANGDEHLLHAWEIAGNTDIVCVLNAQTVRNPSTKRRQLLHSLIIDHGSVSYHSHAFTQAERRTEVEIAIVRLYKKVAPQDDPFFIGMDKEQSFTDFDENSMETGLTIPDAIRDHAKIYAEAKAELLTLSKSMARFSMLAGPLMSRQRAVTDIVKDNLSGDAKSMYNSISLQLNRASWSNIFDKTKLERYMTTKVRENFQEFTMQQGCMAFTEANIKAMFDMLFMNRENILEQALVDVFDMMTNFHRDNRIHIEGWKTNDAHKVNRKVIVPYYIEFDDRYSSDKSGRYSIGYGSKTRLSDIDKALCLITGDQYGDVTLPDRTVQRGIVSCEDALSERFRQIGTIRPGDKYENTCESHFFEFKFWKKGTLHMTFKDEWLWEQFNIRVAKQRNWLPTAYKNRYKSKFNYPAIVSTNQLF